MQILFKKTKQNNCIGKALLKSMRWSTYMETKGIPQKQYEYNNLKMKINVKEIK